MFHQEIEYHTCNGYKQTLAVFVYVREEVQTKQAYKKAPQKGG